MTIGHAPGLFLASLYTAEGVWLVFMTLLISWYWTASTGVQLSQEQAEAEAQAQYIKDLEEHARNPSKGPIPTKKVVVGPKNNKVYTDKKLKDKFNLQFISGTSLIFASVCLSFGITILCIYDGELLGSLMIGWATLMAFLLFIVLKEVGFLNRAICCMWRKAEDLYWNPVEHASTAKAISIGFLLFWVLQDISVLMFLYDGVHEDANAVAFHVPPANYTRGAVQEHLIPGFHWFNRMVLGIGVVIAGLGVIGMGLQKMTSAGFQYMVFFGYAMKMAFGVNFFLLDAYANTYLGENTDRSDGFFGGIRMVVVAGVLFLVYVTMFVVGKWYGPTALPGNTKVVDGNTYTGVASNV